MSAKVSRRIARRMGSRWQISLSYSLPVILASGFFIALWQSWWRRDGVCGLHWFGGFCCGLFYLRGLASGGFAPFPDAAAGCLSHGFEYRALLPGAFRMPPVDFRIWPGAILFGLFPTSSSWLLTG
ncbi:hypothetical protein B0H67DRAFT_587433 [Lasiosphaeris hirsuta]|uniref:Uncharacterized protein n=1 Tax=Lasiosphaeris hirsuta TaxID=260670 RepID=A0AA40A171_9PEZI|nr:hypothetical protein B0H67DRAFT_587433 [Lasiosphaeris hirsuta]